MELTIVGSGTAALEARRGPSGYVLKTGAQYNLLDGGTGTLLKCLQAGVSYKEIDRLFYTHLHPDHTIDLVPFLFATKHTPGYTRTRKLEIFGPVGFHAFLDKFVDVFGSGMLDVAYEIEIKELDETELTLASFKVESRLMQHSQNAIGYRFEMDGRVFAYSGDTDVCAGVLELAKNADVLLLECSFPDGEKVTGHLTPSEAGRIAAMAEVKRLILTHIYPPVQAERIMTGVEEQFSGSVEIARDLMHVQI